MSDALDRPQVRLRHQAQLQQPKAELQTRRRPAKRAVDSRQGSAADCWYFGRADCGVNDTRGRCVERQQDVLGL